MSRFHPSRHVRPKDFSKEPKVLRNRQWVTRGEAALIDAAEAEAKKKAELLAKQQAKSPKTNKKAKKEDGALVNA